MVQQAAHRADTLMVSLHTLSMRSPHGAQRLRGRVRGRLVPEFRPGGKNRRPRVSLFGAVLFVLVVSTATAIASVSPWWVPGYLMLVVMIFVAPPKRQAPSSASESGGEPETAGIGETRRGLRVDHAGEADHLRSASLADPDPRTVESLESMSSAPEQNGVGAVKRRSRTRARRAAKPAREPVTDASPVAWIQVGPGKFVRVEQGVQAAHSPAHSDDRVLESVAEEHGIAPSAFSTAPEHDSSGITSHHDVPEEAGHSVAEIAGRAESAEPSSAAQADSAGFLASPRASRQWVNRIQRGTVRTAPRGSRASSRRLNRNLRKSRLWARPYAPNVSVRDRALRAFGRVPHVQHTLRTRSPPCY